MDLIWTFTAMFPNTIASEHLKKWDDKKTGSLHIPETLTFIERFAVVQDENFSPVLIGKMMVLDETDHDANIVTISQIVNYKEEEIPTYNILTKLADLIRSDIWAVIPETSGTDPDVVFPYSSVQAEKGFKLQYIKDPYYDDE